MQRLAGLVFDTYDDVGGRVLRLTLPDPSGVPDFVKTARRLTPEQIDRTPDDGFALVMFDGAHKMKKYAMVDKGNTALSVVYLLKQAHLLPPAAIKIAATHLIAACEKYKLDVPMELKLAAATGVSGKSQSPYAKKAKVSTIQFNDDLGPPKQSRQNPQLGKADDTAEVKERVNLDSIPGTNVLQVPIFPGREKEKTAGALDVEKRTREQTTRYVDVTNWDPQAAQVEDHVPPQRTLLGDKYPVDSLEQVKTAAAYFEENWKSFHPRDRHEYCVKLASRMGELGMDAPERVERYGSDTYAADVDSYVQARRGLVSEEFLPAIDVLLEKRAYVSPGTFAEALGEFDKMASLRWLWDSQIPDPYYSTFGRSLEKIAKTEWVWDENGTRIREEDLQDLALNGGELLQKKFGPDFLKEFQKKPKAVFESLPAPNKLVLARMASDPHAGTGTE